MDGSKELTELVLSQVKQKFGDNVTLNNILEITAIAMKSAEKWRNGQLTGSEKKTIVLDIVKTIVSQYAEEEEQQPILEYVDTFGGMGIELVIWLSQNPEIIKDINRTNCCIKLLRCCK